MVTRKPVGGAPPPNITTTSNQPPQSSNPLPYPTTPPAESAKTAASSFYSEDQADSPAVGPSHGHGLGKQRTRSDSDLSHGTWDSSDDEAQTPEQDESAIPKPLQITPKAEEKKDELPAILRPGPAGGAPLPQPQGYAQYGEEANANPWAGGFAEQAQRQQPVQNVSVPSNNPYRQENTYEPRSSQSAWQENTATPPAPPANAPPPPPPPPPPVAAPPPVELPTVQSPSQELASMSLGDDSLHRPASWETAEVLAVPPPPVSDPNPYSEQGNEFPTSNPWGDRSPAQQQNAYAPPPGPPPTHSGSALPPSYDQSPGFGDSLIDHPAQEPAARSEEPTPALPPAEVQAEATRQRNEHYQIKHVNWYDASHSSDPRFKDAIRRSPILTQNANGPCPLLALVNALVLSTPQNLDTPLVEALRTREQVSLGLLLDAVFDELMSGRRGDSAVQLPDVSELYAFLLALHTGMNVNPRLMADGAPNKAGGFEATKEMRLYSTFNIPLIHGWIAPQGTPAYMAFDRSAKTFEDAQNIQFAESELDDKLRAEGLSGSEQQMLQDIHTIKAFLNTWPTQLTDHGLERISASMQPGQVAILFRNDHFSTLYKEPKHGSLMTLVTDAGYSSHEEIVWESLVDVNGASSEMYSGDFRGVSHAQDATLHQGSASTEQQSWQPSQSQSRYNDTPQRDQPSNITSHNDPAPPLPGPRPTTNEDESLGIPDPNTKTTEQEDHDLALALQLQEEEEDQQRQAEDRRRREQELSEQYLSSENSPEGPRPPIPPRRSGGGSRQSFSNNNSSPSANRRPAGRDAVHRPSESANFDPEAPPPYSQAASDRPYRPAGQTAPGRQGHPLDTYDALRYSQQGQSTTTVNSTGGRRRSDAARTGRRRESGGGGRGGRPGGWSGIGPGGASGGPSTGMSQQQAYGQHGQQGQRVPNAAGVKDAEDKCVVM